MKKVEVLGFLLLSLIFSGVLIPSVIAVKTDSITVGPSMVGTLIQNLNDGYKFTGNLSIRGDNEIKFWVTDPSGQTILNLGIVSQEASFEFTTQQKGAYTYNFDNNFSSSTSKTVTMTYNIEAVSSFFSSSNLQIGVLVVIVISGVVLFMRARS